MKVYGAIPDTDAVDMLKINRDRLKRPFHLWTYLHGTLERRAGFDIYYFVDEAPETEGIYNVEVMFPDGLVQAMLYMWQSNDLRLNGLCVDITDLESVMYAIENYQKKSSITI